MLKRLIVLGSFLTIVGFVSPSVAYAQEATTCTTVTQYGGSVSYICGAHTPVETGIADSLPLIASGFLGASGVLTYFSKRLKNSI